MLTYLQECGHTITVAVTLAEGDPSSGPIPHIFSRDVADVVQGADVLLTQHQATRAAMKAARKLDLPLVVVEHNNVRTNVTLLRANRVITGLILNSQWLYRDWAMVRPDLPRHMVYPPVNPTDYAVPQPGPLVTQINLSKNGAMLWSLAKLLPETRFLAVKGGYGAQVIPKVIPDNVEVIETTGDPVGKIYARTRILLMPSLYEWESWGRVGMEAASSGIPVIANTLPGLQESLSYAGLFRDAERPVQWAEAITALSDPGIYAAYSKLACQRVQEVWAETQVQLEGLETFLVQQQR